MKLELESIDIKDVQPGTSTHAKDGVLFVDLKELEELILKDLRIQSVEINIVAPGDKVRIVNIMDVIQPRCKINPADADFPGFIGKMQTAGQGKTRSLRGVAVLLSNRFTNRKDNGLLDMGGPVAEMSPYGKMHNVSISPSMKPGTDERDFENAIQIAGFKTAVYLARGADGHPSQETEIFDLDIASLPEKSLPRVALYYQIYPPQSDYMAISDNCVYGTHIKGIMPTVLHPNEVLDGGVVGLHSIKAIDTYSVQNHGVIRELYRHHGKDLNFVGVIAAVASTDQDSRTRSASMAFNLLKNVLGADGVILIKALGGNPHIDLAFTAEKCEAAGIKTAIFSQPLTSSGTLADTLLFNADSLNLIITASATFERVKVHWTPEKFIGGDEQTKVYRPDPVVQRASDTELDLGEFLIPGVLDCTGSSKVIVKEY